MKNLSKFTSFYKYSTEHKLFILHETFQCFLMSLFRNDIIDRQRENVITSRFCKVIEKSPISYLKNHSFFIHSL